MGQSRTQAGRHLRLVRCGRVLALAAALVLGGPSHADVWGYVDQKGVAHFASERLDDRYELFFRDAETFDTTLDAPPVDAPRAPMVVPIAPSKLMAFFEVSPTFKLVRQHMREASNDHNIDFELLQALIAAESGFDASAVSPKGAIGLMQIMPATARRYGVEGDRKIALEKKLTDPKINIKTGTRYLRDLINMFPGKLELAIAAYNAGEGAVQRAGNQIPNYKETQAYVKTVLQLYNVLKPPAPPPEIRHPMSRVRPAIKGGAINRGNLPPSALPSLKPKTESDN
ncbi:MAG: lytic transglycosylase domain-containing protein [Burkholderiaceae bacterium]